jgi:signal transduction histidine kinase
MPSNGESTPLPPARVVGGILLLALAYVLAGRLGLLLAIPPGYATALWPPTGIALAGVIILGPRAIWGVWLGSFLVNLWVSLSVGALSWSTAFMSLSIAGGAALGALAAIRLLTRDQEWSTALERQRDVLRFLFLSIPVMAAVTATWGVGSMLAFGVTPGKDAMMNWLTWWCGDALGAMVFGPLGLVFFGRPTALWRSRRLTVGLPLCGAFFLASTFFILVRDWEGDRTLQRRKEVAEGVETQIKNRLRDCALLMESAAAFFEASPRVDFNQFQAYARAVDARRHGVIALEWAPFVARKDVPSLESWAAREVEPGYRVHPFTSMDVESQLQAPVVFVAPRDSNRAAEGLDLNSEKVRAQGIEAALLEGRPVSTRGIRLVQGRFGFILFQSARGPLIKEAKAPGVLAGAIDALSLLEHAPVPQNVGQEGTKVSIWDGPGPSASPLLSVEASHGKWRIAQPINRGLFTLPIAMGGAQWRMEIATEEGSGRNWVLWFVLSMGALFTGLVGSLLLLVTGRAQLIQDMVEARTLQLRTSDDQLRRQGRLLERTQKAAGVAGWEMDALTGQMTWTQEAAELFKVPKQSVPNLHTALSMLRPEYLETVRRATDRALRYGESFDLEVETVLAHGHQRWLRLTGSAVIEKGQVTGLCGSAQDISVFKEAVRAKDAFVSVVSHELRTPLTSIRGSLGLMLAGVAGQLSDKARELLQLASANCERQIVLVNELLDMERIASGKVELRQEVIELEAFLRQAVKEHEGYAATFGVRLSLEPLEPHLQVQGDPARLHQVLANLLSNACKFSPKNGLVRLGLLGRQGRARIEVQDEGAGIPSEFKARVFQPFTQADSSDARSKGGTGLGLAIARALVERMGGTMGFEAPAEGGTLFWFELPLA